MTTVFAQAKVFGWPEYDPAPRDIDRGYVLSLAQALTRTYHADAHCTLYGSPVRRRLAQGVFERGVAIELTYLAIDIDCPETHGTPEPAPESWRVDLRRKMAALHNDHPNPYYSETRGGARIFYAQREPTVIASDDDALHWKQEYAVILAYLERRFGIKGDESCAAWSWLFRLPHATRAGSTEPEDRLVVGDATQIGVLSIEATKEDVERAQEILPNVFAAKRVLDFSATSSAVMGEGLLYELLRVRGYVLRPHGDGRYVVRCPREHLHSTGRTGDTSTLLFRRAPGEEIGAIHCMHGHCSGLTVAEWLKEFSSLELESARRAAGIGGMRWAS